MRSQPWHLGCRLRRHQLPRSRPIKTQEPHVHVSWTTVDDGRAKQRQNAAVDCCPDGSVLEYSTSASMQLNLVCSCPVSMMKRKKELLPLWIHLNRQTQMILMVQVGRHRFWWRVATGTTSSGQGADTDSDGAAATESTSSNMEEGTDSDGAGSPQPNS